MQLHRRVFSLHWWSHWWHHHMRSWSLIPADSRQWQGQESKPLYVTSYLCLFDFEMLFKLSMTATIGLITPSATHSKDTRVQWELLTGLELLICGFLKGHCITGYCFGYIVTTDWNEMEYENKLYLLWNAFRSHSSTFHVGKGVFLRHTLF